MDHPVFDHEGPWTEDTFRALPDSSRVELVEGCLLVGPGDGGRAAPVVQRVRVALEAALPDGLRVLGPVPLRIGPDCILVPDLVVTGAADLDGMLDARAALLVVEVVGREHGLVNRSFKPQLYALSRIPYSLLVDHDVPRAVAEMIIGGRYHEYARAAAGEHLVLEEPFRLEVDLDAATRAVPSEEEAPAPSA